MQPEKQQVKGKVLTKNEAEQHFNSLFEDEDNTNCFQCGKKTKQWAQTKHAIFLCLSCAATYREVTKVVNVKSVGLDQWNQQQLKKMKLGGNSRFKKFLQRYGLYGTQPKQSLRSIAAQYYRKNLKAQIQGKQSGEPPSFEQGKKLYVANIPITQMTSDQMVQQAKMRLNWAGQKTKYYGTKAFDTVHHKITSGELKQDAKKAAVNVGTTVTSTAKNVWSFLSTKVGQLTKSGQTKPKQASQM